MYVISRYVAVSDIVIDLRKPTIAAGQMTYFEYNRSTRFLLQNTWQTERLQVRVGVVDKACVVVSQQSLDVVEDEAKLVHVFDRLLVCGVLWLQRGGETADGGCVEHFAHLERNQIRAGVRHRHDGNKTIHITIHTYICNDMTHSVASCMINICIN